MEIYILIIEDRHADVITDPFLDRDVAIHIARKIGKRFARDPEDYCEDPEPADEFRAVFSCEGDCVRVVKKELNTVTL